MLNDDYGLVEALATKYYHGFFHRPKWCELDDFKQEAYLALVHAKKYFKPELGYKFSTYFGTVLYNKLANYCLRCHGVPITGGKFLNNMSKRIMTTDLSKIVLEDDFDNIGNVEILYDLDSLLTDTESYIIVRRIFHGRTLTQIGEELDIHHSSVSYHYKKAIKTLRKKWK